MSKISAAFADVQAKSHVLQYYPTIEHKVELWAAVRAYALAVMERALMVGSADHIDDYDAGAEALRKEIEEAR